MTAAPMSPPTPTPAPTMTHAALLPHSVPPCHNARLALFAMRRMGASGLTDAPATNAMINGFGESFRRPLVLMRAFMADLASAAQNPISIAPCCCGRMTSAENTLLVILARAETSTDSAHLLLADLLGLRHADGVLASATAVAQAFADAGRPIAA